MPLKNWSYVFGIVKIPQTHADCTKKANIKTYNRRKNVALDFSNQYIVCVCVCYVVRPNETLLRTNKLLDIYTID